MLNILSELVNPDKKDFRGHKFEDCIVVDLECNFFVIITPEHWYPIPSEFRHFVYGVIPCLRSQQAHLILKDFLNKKLTYTHITG